MPYGLVKYCQWPLVMSHEYGADLDYTIEYVWAYTMKLSCASHVCIESNDDVRYNDSMARESVTGC